MGDGYVALGEGYVEFGVGQVPLTNGVAEAVGWVAFGDGQTIGEGDEDGRYEIEKQAAKLRSSQEKVLVALNTKPLT